MPPPSLGDPGGDPQARREVALMLAVVAAIAVCLRAWMLWTTNATDTAALITLRMSENLAHGQGFVYNAGEPVLGTTAPLWAMVMALVIKLGAPGLAAGKVITIAADGGLCVVTYLWLRQLGHERAGRLASVLIAMSPRLIHWSISGMGASLITLGSISVWLAYAKRRDLLAAVLLGVLFVARWDTLLLTGVYAIAVTLRDRRLPLRSVGVFILTVAPWIVVATLYFGNPIPVTWAAKRIVQQRVLGEVFAPYAREILHILVTDALDVMLSLAALTGLVLLIVRRRTSFYPALAWYALFWVVFVVSKAAPSDRYALRTYPIYLAFASIAAVEIASRAAVLVPRVERWIVPALGATAASVAVGPLLAAQHRLRSNQVFEQTVRAPVGRWLDEHAASSDRVFISSQSSIGYIGYYAHRPILDPKGLVTPEVLPYWSPEHRYPDLAIVRAFRPTWCVVRNDELPVFKQVAASSGHPWDDDYRLAFASPNEASPIYYVFRRNEPTAARLP
ncbi:MAG: hypothetical protein U0359_12765 [Byssovorax sp.]